MMNRVRNFLYILVLAAISLFTYTSCEKLLEPESGDILYSEDVYRNINDADAAIRGLYGKLMNLAPQYVILNELRADLMDVTSNADYTLQQISRHETITDDNKWADPKPFFLLINDCNDIMKNFNIMLAENRFKATEYNQRYCDVAALRCWLYLQVVIHFGKVPYITQPIERIEDLSFADSTKAQWLGIEEMVDTLINCMDNLPYKGNYTDVSLMTTWRGFSARIMFIDKMYLTGELKLWKGDYNGAARIFKGIMERSGSSGLYQYRIPAGDVLQLPRNRFNSAYTRYMANDINSVTNSWPVMFSNSSMNTAFSNTDFYNEWIWVLYFHETYEPNPFIQIFSNTAGNYYLKPSQVIIDDWNNQVQYNGYTKDFRGYIPDKYGNTGSYNMVNGQPVINKFILEYNPVYPYYKPGKWFLWRAAGLIFHYCEAANRDNTWGFYKHKVAHALINDGIWASYNAPVKIGPTSWDYTYSNQTFLPFPYDFDARSTSSGDVPAGLRQTWCKATGIRARVGLQNLPVVADSLTTIEDQIIDESGRELAFEGERWADLVRVAIHRNSNAFLADRIYQKLLKAGYPGAAQVREKLMNRDNWFLPLK